MPKSVAEIAAYVAGEVIGDSQTVITGLASLESVRAGELVYAETERHLAHALASAATTVLVGPGIVAEGKVSIRVQNPKLAFARLLEWFEPEPRVAEGIHATVIIHPSVQLGENVSVGPYTVIEANVRLGKNCQIGAGCYLGPGVTLGDDCVLFPRVTIYRNVEIGARVRIHAGAVIGSDGFGYVFAQEKYWKFPQRGTVRLGDDVELGANVTIDRGALDATIIGHGCKLDNLVHVAHNVTIGEHTVIAAQTGISGSCTVGNYVLAGGQVGIADHCHIEDHAVLGAQAGIPTGKRIRRGQTVWGTPARPLAEFKKQYAYFARLAELTERLQALEKKIGTSRKLA